LCAAAIAAALAPGATGAGVADAVLKIAHRNNPDLFYLINPFVRQAQGFAAAPEEDFVSWWLTEARRPYNKEGRWVEYTPPLFVLPLLDRYAAEPRKLLPLALSAPQGSAGVTVIIALAIAGALHGAEVFPAEWRRWGAETAARWQPLQEVVESRLRKEQEIMSTTERLAAPDAEGHSRLFSKIYGCILAGAIGNAMGSPVEGQHYLKIDRKHPGGITTVLEPSRLESEDDNQMAMLLVETYLERDGLPVLARHFGHTWYERLNRDHFFPFCMGHAYDLIRQGWDPRITGHWIQVTGSTVMCMEPVGAYHLADPEWAQIDATAISYMYQRGLDVTAAAILAAATAEALSPDATVDGICNAALQAAPREPFRTFDQRAFASPHAYLTACLEIADRYDDVLAVRKELYEKCLLYHMIDPLELLGFSLAMFKIARGDVRQAAIGGTNIGRDSDTISGRAAMLSGTLHGVEAVPADWVALFKPAALDRIATNARRWADLIAGPKLARLRTRQAMLTKDIV
ncbi:MAG: ADP-ribosylglycohydrolase family protein, partial [Armatimonadota bacterium]